MVGQPTSVWLASTGKAHVGKRGKPAICGYTLPSDSTPWGIEDDPQAALAQLCGRCLQELRKPGPWTKSDGWVRPPTAVDVYIGGPTEAFQLNELTWSRVIAIGSRQRLTREAVVEVALEAAEAAEDPMRQHIVRALGGAMFLMWGAMVREGWCPEAAIDPTQDGDTTPLLLAWIVASEKEANP